MIVVRHGLMLVGQSFGMKTAAHKVLAAALSDLHEKVNNTASLHTHWQFQSNCDYATAEHLLQ